MRFSFTRIMGAHFRTRGCWVLRPDHLLLDSFRVAIEREVEADIASRVPAHMRSLGSSLACFTQAAN
jgi:hypothetical protein